MIPSTLSMHFKDQLHKIHVLGSQIVLRQLKSEGYNLSIRVLGEAYRRDQFLNTNCRLTSVK